MDFLMTYHTDKGTTKNVNQDSVGYKAIKKGDMKYAMMIVCDGMGGLQKGEMASATVVNAFMEWFERDFPGFSDDFDYALIQDETNKHIIKCNQTLHDYGVENNLQLGTTLSMIIIRSDGLYLIANVGDSRIYLIGNDNAMQLTEDQTYIAEEIKNNRMTKEEAMTSKYRNVLTQCIGVSNVVNPLYFRGKAISGEMFLACSDGFRHFISEDDIYSEFATASRRNDPEEWREILKKITDSNMSKGEKDNITASLVKLV